MGSDDSRHQSAQGWTRNYGPSGHVQRDAQPMPKRTRHAYNSGQSGGGGESATTHGNRNPSPHGEWRGEDTSDEPAGGLLLAGGGGAGGGSRRGGRDDA